jgi:hypothetical protein
MAESKEQVISEALIPFATTWAWTRRWIGWTSPTSPGIVGSVVEWEEVVQGMRKEMKRTTGLENHLAGHG